jgi:hypothetical protein
MSCVNSPAGNTLGNCPHGRIVGRIWWLIWANFIGIIHPNHSPNNAQNWPCIMLSKSYRGTLPKPDSQGRWRPVVGRSDLDKPQRFTVGNKRDTTEAEAQRRLDHIRDLYDRQCAEYGIDYWTPWALPFAFRLAKGPPIRMDASDANCRRPEGQPLDPAFVPKPPQTGEDVSTFFKLKSWGIPVEIADPQLSNSGYGFLRNQIAVEVNQAVEQAVGTLRRRWKPETIDGVRKDVLPENFAEAETRTLHEALDAYSQHLDDTGKRDQNGDLSSRTRKCQDRLRYLKDHHENCPLWKLNLPHIQKMAAYWQNRPTTRKLTRCSWDHAHDMLKELFRFFSWLDDHPAYKWEMPKGAGKISRSPNALPEDDRKEAFQTVNKPTFTPQQLALIAEQADSFGKALIGVCVNCAFGASEVGQWSTNFYRIKKSHPHASKVGIKSTDADSWVVGPRPKTGVYGEHLLWSEVASAVAPFFDGRAVLPITNQGTPWYQTHRSNPQTKFGKWWSDLLDRVEKKRSDFPRLPFGSLRDLLPDILRREFSDEIASICLQHGEVGGDELLKCYANVPFRKLFDATRQLEPMFRPFLEAVAPA